MQVGSHSQEIASNMPEMMRGNVNNRNCSFSFSIMEIIFYHMMSLFSSGQRHVINSVMTICVLTLLREHVTSLTTSVTTMLIFIENIFTLKVIKSYFRSHMIKQILHLWSFYMKFI